MKNFIGLLNSFNTFDGHLRVRDIVSDFPETKNETP